MPDTPLAVFAVHEGFSLFGYGVARDLIRMAADTANNVSIDVAAAANGAGIVESSCGAKVVADHDWSLLAKAQFIFVCSMRGLEADRYDEALINGLRYCHRHGGWVIGMGTGVSALAEAGLLSGRRAAVHPAQIVGMQARYGDVTFCLEPFVIDDQVITAVGGDSVTDMILEFLSRHFDQDISENVRRHALLKPGRSHALMASIGLRGSVEGLDPKLIHFIELVEQSLSAPLSLPAICQTIGVSSRTLTRVTQRAFGCAPGGLSTRIRLSHAADLLRTTNLGVQAIADASGYRSSAHFSESFVRTYGLRPGEYRRANL